MCLWMCQAGNQTPSPSAKATLGSGPEAAHWDSFTGVLYLIKKIKILLSIHQMISSDIFEICKNFKMLSKRTFIFKLHSPKCVYEIIFLRPYSMLCRIAFCSVIYYYSSMACIFYFKLNFSSNCALPV